MFSCYSFQPSHFQPMSSTKSSSSEFYFKLIKWKHFPALYNYIFKNFLCNKETNISAILEESLSFPHSFLEEVWSCYRAFQDYPNSSAAFEKYKRSKELYQRIIEVESDPKEWFNCLLEVKDDEFVIQNVENRIVELDKELWHIYINYLHGKDINAAYEVYTRYINCFLDDTSLDYLFLNFAPKSTRSKNEYIKSRCNTVKPWERTYSHPTQSRKRKHDESNVSALRFSSKNQAKQFFSLPFHTMNAIIFNANPTILEKLNRSCKYFCEKRYFPILRTLIIDRNIKKGQKCASNNALVVSESYFDVALPSTFSLTMALNIKPCSSRSIFSTVSQKIYNSQIRFLTVFSQLFTLAEYENFINPNLLEFIHLENVEIVDADNFYIAFDQIASKLPAAKFIVLENTPLHFRLETPEILEKLERKNKLKHFSISHVEFFDERFCQFFEKHITDDSNICIKMDKKAENASQLLNAANEIVEKWKHETKFKNVTFEIFRS